MLMTGSMSINALADVTYYSQKLSEENEWVGWHESQIGMWWRNADGTHPEDEWVWIDEEPHDRGQARYDTNSSCGTYGILIEKAGVCSDFAAAAISMAKALGLKCASAPEPQNHHEGYYIWVDGVRYRGDNQSLNLDAPALPHDHASVVPMDYFWD